MRAMVVMLMVGLALAGCMEDGDDGAGDEVSEATVAYDGSGAPDRSETALCPDGTGQLVGGATIDDGSLTVMVVDGAGTPVFQRTYDDRVDLEGENLEGAGGDWTVSAAVTDDFDGGYTFTALC